MSKYDRLASELRPRRLSAEDKFLIAFCALIVLAVIFR